MTEISANWPTKDLESVKNCPVCSSSEREKMYSGLADSVFQVAAGKWTMYRCLQCCSSYLDPRPTADSIGRAYENYYTHEAPENINTGSENNKIKKILHGAMNGYLNSKYGTNNAPELKFGKYLIPLAPPFKDKLDSKMRHLSKSPGLSRKLLDVGCGNGRFLVQARNAGWEVEGVDFDHNAVKACKAVGLNVYYGGIDILNDRSQYYDVITISHVIEHVYDPSDLIYKSYALLKPGGKLWLSTPNIDSALSRKYGVDWRGLEPPRHLTLFNYKSLRMLLEKHKFKNLQRHYDMAAAFIVVQSDGIKYSKNNISKLNKIKDLTVKLFFFALITELCEYLNPSSREFIVITAIK